MIYNQRSFRTSSEAYKGMLELVREHGKPVPSRLGMTRELSTVTDITQPQYVVPFLFGRKFNYFGMLAESLWILSDIEEYRILETWNGNLGQHSDDGLTLYGAYGPRIQKDPDQLEAAIQTLSADHDSRQAVISILRPTDAGKKTKDFPCNDMIMFKIRDGRLCMTVINRSNDIHWGLFGVNMPQFGMLMRYVAGRVGVPVGLQTHVSDSLHLYLETDQHKEITERISSFDKQPNTTFHPNDYFQINRELPPLFGELGDHKNYPIRKIFDNLNQGEVDIVIPPELGIYWNLLLLYRDVKRGIITRAEAIDSIPMVLEEIEYIPYDWIFGCLYTLVSQSKDRVKAADAAIEIWKSLPEANDFIPQALQNYLRVG